MNPKVLKMLALVSLVIAALLGLTAYRMSSRLVHTAASTQTERAATPDAKTQAVVVVKALLANQPIPADAVQVVPVAVAPAHFFSENQAVVGKRPQVAVAVGTTLTPEYFQAPNSLSHQIPEGHVALSLKIDDVIAVGGLVAPGDLVDVLVYVRNDGREVESAQARVLLHAATVLSLNGQRVEVQPEPEAEPPKPDSRRRAAPARSQERHISNVVLAVPEADATRVMLGASVGELRLALLPQPDDAPADETPALPHLAVVDQPAATAAKTATPEAELAAQLAAQKPITVTELTRLKAAQKTRPAPASKPRIAPPQR